jgi:prepilin-type N-terminal cleavage/methylation domain-containing protein
MKFHSKNVQRINGLSLLELVAVVAVMGILTAIVLPNLSNVMPYARDQNAISKAVTLEQAMLTYYKRIPNSATTWAAQDDAGRYTLLHDAGYLPGSPATLTAFQPRGYSYSFSTTLTTARVTITGPDGTLDH